MIRRLLISLALCATPVFADPASVQNVSVYQKDDSYTFKVTIMHNDSGWDDYADAWRIKDLDGNILGKRALAHPHVNERPFTRSLSGVFIPEAVTTVVVEVHNNATGWAEATKIVKLP